MDAGIDYDHLMLIRMRLVDRRDGLFEEGIRNLVNTYGKSRQWVIAKYTKV